MVVSPVCLLLSCPLPPPPTLPGPLPPPRFTGAVTVATDGTRVTASRHYNASHPYAEAWGFDGYYTLRMYTREGLRLACSQALPSVEVMEGFAAQDVARGETVHLA